MSSVGDNSKRKAGVIICLLAGFCPCAFSLNPSLQINQYAHKAWTVRDGFFRSKVLSIAQTPDGYLWIGTDSGLVRFDGARTVDWQPPAGENLPGSFIRSLLAGRDGTLWIGTNRGLASWKAGRLTRYPGLAGHDIQPLYEDREGTVWAGLPKRPSLSVCTIRSGSTECSAEDGKFGLIPGAIFEDSRSNLWVETETGLWRWKPGPPRLYPMKDEPRPDSLIEAAGGNILIATTTGVKQFSDGKIEVYPVLGGKPFQARALLRDRDGGLWIGTTDRGLLHVSNGRTDVFSRSNGLSDDFVFSLFEDREGNIWVATTQGLDRFRDPAVPTISVEQGLSSAVVLSVLTTRDGSVWVGTQKGLNQWRDGQIVVYPRPSGRQSFASPRFQDSAGRIWISGAYGTEPIDSFENGRFLPLKALSLGPVPWSIEGDNASNVWISRGDGLFRLTEGASAGRISWATLGRQDDAGGAALALLPDPSGGGLWLAFFQGVAYFKDGQVRQSYSAANGLGEGRVEDLRFDRDGAVWAATEGGLSRIEDGRVATLSSRNGLPCDAVHWTMEDDEHSVWAYLACGLVRIARSDLEAWARDPKRTVHTTVFDASDGVASFALGTLFNPQVARAADGRIWFVSGDGVSIIDPRHIPFNKLPPPVHVEEITADRKSHWRNLSGAASNPLLPELSRDLRIDYTALSLVAPEKVRFKYKLEGHDDDWVDAGGRRQAFYNDLGPRSYRFRVIASNNSSVWNETGDSVEFSIAPAYYQTAWFRASEIVAFVLLLSGLYRLRLYQLSREFNAQLEGRVDERLRVARDLHDTLLQSFQGLMLRFQTARNMVAKRPAAALEVFDTALVQADRAIVEGREAIQNMRSSTVVTNDLAEAVRAVGSELASEGSSEPASGEAAEFRFVVEGKPRDLHPILRDEIYRIAREAIGNAFRHAQARVIETEITYGDDALTLRVRDDGVGIDAAILNDGRPGHYGVPGMRERAAAIGTQLEIWTREGAGTEIQLKVPGPIAYKSLGAQRKNNLERART
jgi:signal transduction histidine kinase/ligand-binding sensor domain-containing protein